LKIQSQKDFFAGLMFTVVGGSFAAGASQYTLGSGAKMGPGYFPLILGILLAVLGCAIAVKSMITPTPDGDKVGKFAWKPLFFIIAANLVFGASIGGLPLIGLKPLGLIVGIYLLTYIASHAGEEHNFKEVAVLATILAALSYVAFIVLLKLQFPVWPAYFTA
jgi:Tripartite tricarboxylate transporter TctB family